EGYLHDGDELSRQSRYMYRAGDSKIWIMGQLGLCRAIRQLMELNAHVKIFTAIRKEALDRIIFYDNSAFTLVGLSAELTYNKYDLHRMFSKHANYAERETDRSSSNVPLRYDTLQILNPFTRRFENFIDFALRHTLDCPRDLMRIGGRIAQLHSADLTAENVRAAIYEASNQIINHYLWEMRRFTGVPADVLFSVIEKNVMDRHD